MAPRPADPYNTPAKIDRRLAEVARILRSPNITRTYRATLTHEADQLLDRRLTFTTPELVQTG